MLALSVHDVSQSSQTLNLTSQDMLLKTQKSHKNDAFDHSYKFDTAYEIDETEKIERFEKFLG